jgi:hypothetical protein
MLSLKIGFLIRFNIDLTLFLRSEMMKKFLLALALVSTAYASELDIGVKLYSDGLYSLAAKTFKESLRSFKEGEFKKYYRYAYLSFLKSGDFSSLKELVELWQSKYPNFKRGELLALQTVLALKKGVPIEEAFPKKELQALPIEEKLSFFRALSSVELNPEESLFVLNFALKSPELKGAVKESGFLKKALSRAIKEGDYSVIDFIFDNYGRWFKSKEESLQFVRYLERKKRFPEALLEAKKLYKRSPGPDTRFELARAYYLNGKYGEVVKLIKEPTSQREKYLLAWSYFKLK